MKEHHCKFCGSIIDIDRTYPDYQSFSYECLECEVNYSFNDDDSIYIMSYDIDEEYLFVMMDFLLNKTYIYLADTTTMNNPMIEIDGIYPDTHPNDIVALADRLMNLLAFTWTVDSVNSHAPIKMAQIPVMLAKLDSFTLIITW